jgi:hypothetical protein
MASNPACLRRSNIQNGVPKMFLYFLHECAKLQQLRHAKRCAPAHHISVITTEGRTIAPLRERRPILYSRRASFPESRRIARPEP